MDAEVGVTTSDVEMAVSNPPYRLTVLEDPSLVPWWHEFEEPAEGKQQQYNTVQEVLNFLVNYNNYMTW